MAARWTAELLKAKNVDIDAQSTHQQTALIFAAGRGHKGVVEMLLEAGADVAIKDEDGKTAKHYASDAGHAEIVALLEAKAA